MNPGNDKECEEWLRCYDLWRSDPARQMHELPKKPRGFDLWLQGSDPLFKNADSIPCKGGDLSILPAQPPQPNAVIAIAHRQLEIFMNDTQTPEEQVLAIPTSAFIEFGAFEGFKPAPFSDMPHLASGAGRVAAFTPRSQAEGNAFLKQLIPYVAIIHGDEIFTYRRSTSGGEDRLHGQLSIGLGGHVNPEDHQDLPAEAVIAAAMRELLEEVGLEIDQEVLVNCAIGMVNDDSNLVGRDHLGICFVINISDEARAAMKFEHSIIEPKFMPMIELAESPEALETWSASMFEFIMTKTEESGKWHDEGFLERLQWLSMTAAQMSASALVLQMARTGASHMRAREALENTAGAVHCMMAGIIANEDIDGEGMKAEANIFRGQIETLLRHQ